MFLLQKNLSGKTKNLVKKSKKFQESWQEIRENPRIKVRQKLRA